MATRKRADMPSSHASKTCEIARAISEWLAKPLLKQCADDFLCLNYAKNY